MNYKRDYIQNAYEKSMNDLINFQIIGMPTKLFFVPCQREF